jgi:hypothetical protein
MRKFAMLAVLALVAVPAAYADSGSGQTNQPNALCKQQQTAIGAKTFKLLYGANAYGHCVSKMASTLNADKTNAAKQCAAERADAAFPSTHGGKTFAQFYGTGKQAATRWQVRVDQGEGARPATAAGNDQRGQDVQGGTHETRPHRVHEELRRPLERFREMRLEDGAREPVTGFARRKGALQPPFPAPSGEASLVPLRSPTLWALWP